MHQDKSVLTRAKDQIIERLNDVEKLEVHPNKIYLQKSDTGFSFLGIYILPHRRYVGRRIKKGLYDSLSDMMNATDEQIRAKEMKRHVSYRGFLKHHNCNKLENTMQLLSAYAKHK